MINPPIFAPIIVIENRVYLVLNNKLLSDLELGFKFVTITIPDKNQSGVSIDRGFPADLSFAKYKYNDDDGWDEYDYYYSDCNYSSKQRIQMIALLFN